MLRKAFGKLFRLPEEDEKPRIQQRTFHLDFTVNKQNKEDFEDEDDDNKESTANSEKVKDILDIPSEDEGFKIIKVRSNSKGDGYKLSIPPDPGTSGVIEAVNTKADDKSKRDCDGDLLRPKKRVSGVREATSPNTIKKGLPKEVGDTTEATKQNTKMVDWTSDNPNTKRTTNQSPKIKEKATETPVAVYENIDNKEGTPLYQNIPESKEANDEPRNRSERKTREISYKFGDVLEAIASYNPSTDKEISLKTGDKIEIGDHNSSSWRKATNLRTKETGYVHINHLGGNLDAKPWYFGDISFYQARTLLEDGKTGTFLVYRRPYDPKIPYALLLRFKNQTKNYGIYKEDNTYHISEGFFQKSLVTLIEAYKQDENLSLGLCTRLTQACVKLDPTINDLSVDFKDKLEIARADIKIGKLQGKGYSSEVYEGKWRNKDIAIKSLSGNFSKEDFEKELLLLKKLKHNNIVQFYGISTQLKPFFIVLEFMKIGDLATYLKKQALEEYQRIHIASQVADGMVYLAKEGVVHRDLAARNVLLQDKLTAKISDVGISRLTDAEDKVYMATTPRKLPIRWLAPECATESRYSEQSDVWAFSILLMEIYTRERPYKELKMASKDFLQRIKDGYRMGKPDNMPDDIFELCTLCWNKHVKLRPKFKYISSFFHDFMIDRAQIL